MNKRFSLIGILLLAVLCIWLSRRSGHWQDREKAAENSTAATSRLGGADPPDAAASLPTKVAIREKSAPLQTHSPERLKEFMLPVVVIDGLSLKAATQKLLAAYEDACRKSGETALPLSFVIPQQATRLLKVRLPAGNFNTSVQLLATLSGMKASRQDREYRFEPLADEYQSITRKVEITPDFNTSLAEMAGETKPDPSDPFASSPAPVVRKSVQDWLKTLGLDLDPSTHLSMESGGKLALETTSTADAAAVTALIKSISEQPRNQLEFATKIVELPAGSEWTPMEAGSLTDDEVQLLMRKFAQTKGTDLMTFPSATAASGQKATVSEVQEVIYPTDDSGKNFEKREAGKRVDFQGGFLGFGQEIGVTYRDTTYEFDPTAPKHPVFTDRAKLSHTGFITGGVTRFVRQTREDGTETLLLITSQKIDANGRPVP